MEAEEDAAAEAELERELSRVKRRRGAAGNAGTARRRAATKGKTEEPVGVLLAAAPAETMEVGDAAGKAITARRRVAKVHKSAEVGMEAAADAGRTAIGDDDDVCAEEPDAEAMRMDEEEAAALEAEEEQAMGGAGSVGARKSVARPSTERGAVDGAASDDHFVGEPVPDGEARRRWPERYRVKDSANSHARRSDVQEKFRARCHYRAACVDGTNFELGDDVYMKAPPGEEHYIGRITEFFEGMDHGSYFSCHWFYRVAETVVSPEPLKVHDHRHDPKRIFLSDHKDDNIINSIISKININYVDPKMAPQAKAQIISKSDFYYDMSYSVSYSTFANMPAENGDATSSESSDISCDDVESSKEKPIADLAAPPVTQMDTATLLDLYSGCGAMSTGLCQGAALAGIKLNTKWAVDMNRHACNSLKRNHPHTQVRNVKAEDFLSLLRHWDALCKKYDVHTSNSLDSTLAQTSNDDEDEPLPEGTFEVEKIVDICYGDPNRTGNAGLWVKVRWKAFDRSQDTWEPIDGLSNSTKCINFFVESGYRESILPLPVLPKFPLPTHDVANRGLIPKSFSHCVVAYMENEDRHLKKALVLSDAISDLPKVGNNQPKDVMEYEAKATTEFQRYIRLDRKEMKDYSCGDVVTPKELFDHQPLQLNSDDYERGANFRDLEGVQVPNYAMTYIKGKSLKPFGRLWWDETVSTVVTRAEPHTQIILHPTQHRVLTVRENARLQGFPDYYRLSGPIKQKYIQVGNAVAFPVARALGYSLGQAYQGECSGDQPLFQLPGNFIPVDQSTVTRAASAGTSGG
ncbi:unnamed protein product [Alopecurus aequalis]